MSACARGSFLDGRMVSDGRTLEALRDREADCHSTSRRDESIVFSRTVDDEHSTVQSQEYRENCDDGKANCYA